MILWVFRDSEGEGEVRVSIQRSARHSSQAPQLL
jgi:hypothetical protein